MKRLLTGNEALARGAYEAGVRFASAYPGTPSTEILQNITAYKEITSEWAPNEKVAMEAAIGASIAGVRSMVSMKHVGLNVAADPLFTFAYTGVNAGMVIVTSDEPGQHSSQNEQDNRNYAKAAKIPMLEPSDSQEAKEMIKEAFNISESFDTPVLIRMTTRSCHSKSIVNCEEPIPSVFKPYKKDVRKYLAVPAFAREMRKKVEERTRRLLDYSEASPLNRAEYHGTAVGVIASGVSYYYAREIFGNRCSYLKLGFTHPLPEKLIRSFCSAVGTVYVIEENDPYIEEKVKSLGIECHGKDLLPSYGEMLPEVLREKLLHTRLPEIVHDSKDLVERPPVLCAGCPHRGIFYLLGKQKNIVIAGDIGCYTLGFTEPYNAMDFNVCMGAGFSTGHGAQKAFDIQNSGKRVVSIMGDSTFFHTGINSLIEVLYNNSRTVNVILDNRITGMTGHQENPGTGRHADSSLAPVMNIETIVRALGATHVRVINPNNLKETGEALDWALSLNEPSVIITRWPCLLKRFSPADRNEFPSAFSSKHIIGDNICIGCRKCLSCGCPAISMDNGKNKAVIDREQCMGCGVCAQICPRQAIIEEGK